MAKFNYKRILESVASSPAATKRVNTIASKKFDAAKASMLLDFEEHKVTQELRSGPDGTNLSNTLGGKGNLFSFIGFNAGDKPVDNLKNVLETEVVMTSSKQPQAGSGRIKYRYSLRIPNESLEGATPMPWQGGKSWATGIEKGISGFSKYLRGKFKSPDPSRSGTGIQAKNEVRSGEFKPVPYLTQLFSKLVESITSK